MNIGMGTSDKPVALFVWGDLPLGGAERRFFRLFNYLQNNGHNVRLYTSDEGAAACRSLDIFLDRKNVHVFPRLQESKYRLIRYLSLIRLTFSLVRQVRADGIRHLHFGENPGALSFLYALVSQYACSFSVSLVDSIKDYQRSNREKVFAAIAAKFSNRIDCLSDQIKADLCLFLGKGHESKCLVSPCSFTERKVMEAAPKRDIDISFIGRMIPTKGHRLLKNALVDLGRASRSGLVIHVCGSGPLEQEIRQEFGAIKNQILHIHYEDNPFQILLRTKIYVALQEIENYPSQSLLEAMTCGCAIVATDVGLTRRLLDESCAILIPAEPAALAEALMRLLDNEALRCELGQSAENVVTSKHTIETFADYFLTDLCGMKLHRLESGVASRI